MYVGIKIKELRIAQGLTQAELAEKLAITHSMVAQIERGSKTLSVPLAIEIAAIFDYDIDELCTGKKALGKDTKNENNINKDNLMQNSVWVQMSVGQRIKILRLTNNMTAIELAERVGVARSMISQIERGSRTLSIPLAIEIAKVFEVSLFILSSLN